MFYVFHVDRGVMLKLDMNVALGPVENLKKTISHHVKIPPESQILLVSGGMALHNSEKVMSYNGGTDSSPIFLFSKFNKDKNPRNDWRPESPASPPNLDIPDEERILEHVKWSKTLRPSYEAIKTRTNLAQKLYETAVERTKLCCDLVLEQHLQQQGWAAAVANLDEIRVDLKSKWDSFRDNYEEYLKKREYYVKLVNENLPEDTAYLAKIPLLPCLVEKTGETSAEDEQATLLDWVGSQRLDDLARRSSAYLETMNEDKLLEIEKAVESCVFAATRKEVIEIGGLSDRLTQIDRLLGDAKSSEKHQKDMWLALQQNRSRADALQDKEVISDLCQNHGSHLNEMIKCNERLKSHHQRFWKAKEELSASICHRVRCLYLVQQRMFEAETNLAMYRESLRRLLEGLTLVEKFHLCPQLYLNGVVEVARRRAFSEAFLKWSSEVAARARDMYEEEVTVREGLNAQMRSHFLSMLFPGLNEFPPDFATNAPEAFDKMLPNVSWDDIQQLKEALPSDASWTCPDSLLLTLPKLQLETVNLFGTSENENLPRKDARKQSVDMFASAVEETSDDGKLKETEADSVGEKESMDADADDEVFRTASESEDTRDGSDNASVTTLRASEASLNARRHSMKTASTSTEGTLCNSQMIESIVDRYRAEAADFEKKVTLLQAQNESKAAKLRKIRNYVVDLRKELFEVKKDREALRGLMASFRSGVDNEVTRLSTVFAAACSSVSNNHRDNEESVILKVKAEMDACVEELGALHRKELQGLTEQLENLHASTANENDTLRRESAETKSLLESYQRKWEDEKRRLLEDKEREINRFKDAMTLEMEVELENLRGSVEKQKHMELEAAKQDLTRTKLEVTRILEEKSSLDALVQRLQGELEYRSQELLDVRSRLETEKEERKRELLQHKVEIDGLRSRYRMMTMTSSTLSQSPPSSLLHDVLPSSHSPVHGSRSGSLRDAEVMTDSCSQLRFSAQDCVMRGGATSDAHGLAAENARLQSDLEAARRRIGDLELMSSAMTNSIAPCAPGEEVPVSDAELVRLNHALKRENSSLREQLLAMPRQTSSLLQSGKISLTSCNSGDVILVLWDSENHRYAIYQEGAPNFFLHLDSVRELGLATDDGGATPRKLYMVAEVVQRETCLAKKEGNRYNLPKGYKFYRVRVKPWPRPVSADECN